MFLLQSSVKIRYGSEDSVVRSKESACQAGDLLRERCDGSIDINDAINDYRHLEQIVAGKEDDRDENQPYDGQAIGDSAAQRTARCKDLEYPARSKLHDPPLLEDPHGRAHATTIQLRPLRNWDLELGVRGCHQKHSRDRRSSPTNLDLIGRMTFLRTSCASPFRD